MGSGASGGADAALEAGEATGRAIIAGMSLVAHVKVIGLVRIPSLYLRVVPPYIYIYIYRRFWRQPSIFTTHCARSAHSRGSLFRLLGCCLLTHFGVVEIIALKASWDSLVSMGSQRLWLCPLVLENRSIRVLLLDKEACLRCVRQWAKVGYDRQELSTGKSYLGVL